MKTELGDAGFPGWVAFSKRSTKFDLVGCEREWKQYAPGKGLTMASLVLCATEDDSAATLLWKQKWCKEERSSYQICQGMQQGIRVERVVEDLQGKGLTVEEASVVRTKEGLKFKEVSLQT